MDQEGVVPDQIQEGQCSWRQQPEEPEEQKMMKLERTKSRGLLIESPGGDETRNLKN